MLPKEGSDNTANPLESALKTYFGYDSFRPYQHKIINDVLNSSDTIAVLPTGAGKSICYQLPAVISGGTTIVVSPLIALMKDQVDQLNANGISSTFINSSLTLPELRERIRGFKAGLYKLVYVAPERLVKEDFLAIIKDLDICRFAIDEAHCISEWGHDFRPEYRQLRILKELFPKIPVIALTATATPQVKDDISRQLNLVSPAIHLASFNRPNLSYKVVEREGNGLKQICAFLEKFKNESGIIYCGTRDQTESLTQDLIDAGYGCVAYHAGMSNQDRAKNQEHFIKDEVGIICATIAFGMGINKPNVRFVIHYDLPKNIEGYYQETGRAGRDGLPAECLLVYNYSDIRRIKWIIQQKTDSQDIENSERQLQFVLSYAQSRTCRRQHLLNYFGEITDFENCQSCDNCTETEVLYDATVSAYKFISTILRIEQLGSLRFGVGHVSQILAGKDSPKLQRWGHQKITTFGIGNEFSETEWTQLGRSLINHGYISLSTDQYPTCSITEKGREAVRNKLPIQLPQLRKLPSRKSKSAAVSAQDKNFRSDSVFDSLKLFRAKLARERGVPAYVVFGDVTLKDMAVQLPATESQFLNLQGVGQVKLREYGKLFMDEIARLTLKSTANSIRSTPVVEEKQASRKELIVESIQLFNQGVTIDEIAQKLFRVRSTIAQYLEEGIQSGMKIEIDKFIDPSAQKQIFQAISKKGDERLAPIKELVDDEISYEQIRVYRSWIKMYPVQQKPA